MEECRIGLSGSINEGRRVLGQAGEDDERLTWRDTQSVLKDGRDHVRY